MNRLKFKTAGKLPITSTMGKKTCAQGPEPPPNIKRPMELNAARSSMQLRSGSGEVRMLAPVGPFFWPSPFWPLNDFF